MAKNHHHDYFDIVITIIKDDYSLILEQALIEL